MLNLILLQAAKANQGGSLLTQLLFIGGILLIFYLFMILPQQRKQKDMQKFRESLKVGDDVITIGGLHGKVVSLNDSTVTIQVDKNIKLVFEKAAISIEATRRKQAQGSPKKDNKDTKKEIAEAIK
jgi:preprotein translocase subunit YajC